MGFSKQLFSRNLGKDLLKAVTKNCKNHHHMTITLLYTHSHPSSVCPCHLRFKYSYFWRHFPDGQSRTKTGLWTTFSPSFTFPNFSRIECEHLHFSRTKINVILHYEIRYFSCNWVEEWNWNRGQNLSYPWFWSSLRATVSFFVGFP